MNYIAEYREMNYILEEEVATITDNPIDMAWSDSLELAVVISFHTSGGIKIRKCTDGVLFQPSGSVPSNFRPTGVCWSPELGIFVVVSDIETSVCVLTSVDGQTWIGRNAPLANWMKVCWSPELGIFVATAYGASSTDKRFMSSSDGINWVLETTTSVGSMGHVVWAAKLGLFMAACRDANPATPNHHIYTSPDGDNWTSVDIGFNRRFQVIEWSEELGIAVSIARNSIIDPAVDLEEYTIITSTDGVLWQGVSEVDNPWMSLNWIPELGAFFALSSNGNNYTKNNYMSSFDGISWKHHKALSFAPNFECSVWMPKWNLIYAVDRGTNDTFDAQRILFRSITIDLTESITVDKFRVVVIESTTGMVSCITTITAGITSIPVLSVEQPVHVMITPVQGVLRKNNYSYLVGDRILPENTVTTPYWFECTTSGISATSPPVYTHTVGGFITDGTVVWENRSELERPYVAGPFIPEINPSTQ